MPKYLDSHPLGGITEEQLRQTIAAPTDQNGVKTTNVMYNANENKLYCVSDAPNKDAVDKHHRDIGLNCDWITEVKTIA